MSADLRLGRWQDVLADIPDGSVRLILTSPPYDNARTYEGTNEPVDFCELARFALRVLMPGGTLAMVLDAPMKDGRQSVTPYRVICEWAEMKGWAFRQFLTYGRKGVPGNTPGFFRKDHEPLLVFVRDGGEHVCEKDRIAERRPYGIKGAGGLRANGIDRRDSCVAAMGDKVLRGSAWWYGAGGANLTGNTGHPAPFAEAFALDAVTVWSNPGDLVVDPFAGSATVGRACVDIGRRFIGTRSAPKYHAIGMARLAQTSIFSAGSFMVEAGGAA